MTTLPRPRGQIYFLFQIAFVTFKEIYKSKILLNIFFIGLGLSLLTFVASEFTFGTPQKVALDLGLGCLSLSVVGIALFMGVNLITKEIENRTLYMILSRPVKRWIFISGRLLGLASILAVNTLILSSFTLALFLLLGGKSTPLLYWSLFFTWLEGLFVLFLVVFFSMISGNMFALFFTTTLYIIGHAVDSVLQIGKVQNNPLLRGLLEFYSKYLPNFEKFNLKDYVLYEDLIEMPYLSGTIVYACLYFFILGLATVWVFERKELN